MYARSTTFTPRRQQQMRRNQNATRFRSNVKLGPVAHTVLVALMVAVLGLIYLTQATKTSGTVESLRAWTNRLVNSMLKSLNLKYKMLD